MPEVYIRARVPGHEPHGVLETATDFARWPDMSDDVVSVRVEPGEGGEATSWWEVLFREGILKWSQRESHATERVSFELIEGDPLTWHGGWTAEADGAGTVLTLEGEFDLGMPSISHVLDPMGVEAIEDAVQSVFRTLFGEGVEFELGRAPQQTG